MNTLRLKNINLHAPYKVMQDPERHNNFYFVSDYGTRFDIDFTVNDSIIPSGAYEFGITNKQNARSPLDYKLRLTIFAIIEEFFEVNGHDTTSCRARHGVTLWLEVLQESERFLPKSLAGSRKMLTFAALTSFIHLNLNAYESKNEEKLCEIWQNAW